jgi:hypothetical protein
MLKIPYIKLIISRLLMKGISVRLPTKGISVRHKCQGILWPGERCYSLRRLLIPTLIFRLLFRNHSSSSTVPICLRLLVVELNLELH